MKNIERQRKENIMKKIHHCYSQEVLGYPWWYIVFLCIMIIIIILILMKILLLLLLIIIIIISIIITINQSIIGDIRRMARRFAQDLNIPIPSIQIYPRSRYIWILPIFRFWLRPHFDPNTGDHPMRVFKQVPFPYQVTPYRKHRLAPATNFVDDPLASSTPSYLFQRQLDMQD